MKPIRIPHGIDPARYVALLVANRAVPVTRCPDGVTHGCRELTRKHGGVLPAHLDPRVLV